MILRGDFRQVPQVVLHDTICETIDACILNMKYDITHFTRETKYMSREHVGFFEFFIHVSDVHEPYVIEDPIEIRGSMVKPWSGNDPTKKLIHEVFTELFSSASNSKYMIDFTYTKKQVC